jgi:hypothetical protein
MRLRSGGNGFLAASMDFLSRSDAEYLRLAIAAVPRPSGRVTQDGLVSVAENRIHGPQSMSGAFWGSRTALWTDSIPQPTHSMLGGRGSLFGNLLIYNVNGGLKTLPQVAGRTKVAAYSCGFLLNAMAAAIHKMLLVPFLRRGVSPSRFPAAAD